MCVVAALCRRYRVFILTRGGFKLDELNRLAGTEVRQEDIAVQIVSRYKHFRVGTIRHAGFLQEIKRRASSYDACISLSGVLPWGRPAIHFISSAGAAFPSRDPRRKRSGSKVVIRALVKDAARRVFSFGLGERDISGVFVSNSEWTLRRMACKFSGRHEVIYPPLSELPEANIDFESRSPNVLLLGRIDPEKDVLRAVQIVGLARERGFKGGLTIIGDATDSSYAASVMSTVSGLEWVEVLPAIFGHDKLTRMQHYAFGINCCVNEAFGISTAEMAAAGLLVLVPRDTGQAEIPGLDAMGYATNDEAVQMLLEPPITVSRWREHVTETRIKLGALHAREFAQKVRNLVEHFLLSDSRAQIPGH